MAKNTDKKSASQLRAFRSQVAKLKAKGLVSSKVDARSQKQTKYMKSIVRKYADVLSGKAAVVNVGRKTAKEYDEKSFRPRFGKIAVRKEKGERVYFDKKSKTVKSTRKAYGNRVTKLILPQKKFDIEKLPKARKGYRTFYSVPFNGWTSSPRFENMDELRAFMQGYEVSMPNWMKYVEIEEISKSDLGEDEGDGDE
jgi:hypothetical protein